MAKPTKTALIAAAQLEANNRDLITHEFIPYACHYAPDTILTKNGELIQFIKLSDSGGDNDHEFRENLRNAINDAIDPSRFSVWVHTIRSKSEVKGFEEGEFGDYVDYLWRQTLPSEIHFRNEIYLSIVIDSTQFEPWKMKSYLRSLSKAAEEQFRKGTFEEKHELLSRTTNKIMEKLKVYNAEKLGLYDHNDSYYSEVMEFARTLMGINYSRQALPLADVSVKLKPEHLGFNTYSGLVTIIDKQTSTRKFGAVISIKESIGITAPALQDLLNCNAEFIISQSLDFAYGNRFLPALREQLYFNSVSLDKNFLESASLQGTRPDNPDNFVLQQTSLTIIKSTEAELIASIGEVQKRLQQLGLVAYLEDINSERIYWANMPGNFAFLKRQDIMQRNSICNFACFGVDKYTTVDDCLFGKPVMFFETQEHDIFALHFLANGEGHMLIVGSDEATRHTFAGLIAAEANYAGAEIMYYDHYGKYETYADAVEATYFTTLDLDHFATAIEGDHVKVLILNSIKPILDNDGHKAFQKFLEYAGERNCVVIVCEPYEDNCELLLADFTTTAFFPIPKVTEQFADNYDIFEDERQMIETIPPEYVYCRHGYEEMTLRFKPSPKLRNVLLEGKLDE